MNGELPETRNHVLRRGCQVLIGMRDSGYNVRFDARFGIRDVRSRTESRAFHSFLRDSYPASRFSHLGSRVPCSPIGFHVSDFEIRVILQEITEIAEMIKTICFLCCLL